MTLTGAPHRVGEDERLRGAAGQHAQEACRVWSSHSMRCGQCIITKGRRRPRGAVLALTLDMLVRAALLANWGEKVADLGPTFLPRSR